MSLPLYAKISIGVISVVLIATVALVVVTITTNKDKSPPKTPTMQEWMTSADGINTLTQALQNVDSTNTFKFNLVGNVTGNVKGNVKGNVTGETAKFNSVTSSTVKGDLTGSVTGSLNGSVNGIIWGHSTCNHDGGFLTAKVPGVFYQKIYTANESCPSTGCDLGKCN